MCHRLQQLQLQQHRRLTAYANLYFYYLIPIQSEVRTTHPDIEREILAENSEWVVAQLAMRQ
jgi:hypothetical protein